MRSRFTYDLPHDEARDAGGDWERNMCGQRKYLAGKRRATARRVEAASQRFPFSVAPVITMLMCKYVPLAVSRNAVLLRASAPAEPTDRNRVSSLTLPVPSAQRCHSRIDGMNKITRG